MSDDDLTLEDLDKLRPIFLWVRIFLSLLIIGLTVFAGIKAWFWYFWIPFCAIMIFCIRLFGNILKNTFISTEKEIRQNESTTNSEFSDKRAAGNVSMDEFLEMSPAPYDERRISDLDSPSDKAAPFNPKLVFTSIFVMLMVGIFWYGLGMILGLIFK